jgi:methylamine dehydrogenase accessory protein MauD
MTVVLWISCGLLWGAVLLLGFLLLGTLRAVGLLSWRVQQLEATTPSRIGRSGLKPGKRAPDFSLPSVDGAAVALHDFAGRKVLLVFTQSGCGPCRQIVPELNKLQRDTGLQVLVVNNGEMETTRKWVGEVRARFPVVVQDRFSLSKRYEALATPFAFLIDEQGVIASKGIVSNAKHIGFVLSETSEAARNGHGDEEPVGAEAGDKQGISSPSQVQEIGHE